MYQVHPCFEPPPSESTRIWKYMDFAKFVSMLDQKALFFASSALFEDPYEGLYSNATAKLGKNITGYTDAQSLHKVSTFVKETVFLNCWHMSEVESAAMWDLYSEGGAGISIQSNFGKLKECFSKCKFSVYIGVVNYIDWNVDTIPTNNTLYPFLCKRKSFTHECEIRASVCFVFKDSDGFYFVQERDITHKFEPFVEGGIYVLISLDTLIDRIFVSPKSPKWFVDLVKSVSQKYGLDKEVIQSDLYKGPLY
jgi:hypothetical protein